MLGPTFHRSFPLQRAVLSEYLRAAVAAGGALSATEARRSTSLGTMKIPSALGYGRATGLLDESGKPTSLGRLVCVADPHLSNLKTHWLLHAGITQLVDAAPAYWGRLWFSMRAGSVVERSALDAEIISTYKADFINVDSAKVCGTAFVSTYTGKDCLGDLGLLRKERQSVGAMSPNHIPDAGVFSYTVAKEWSRVVGNQVTTSMDSFLKESRLAELFRLDSDSINELFEQMAQRGQVELHRSAPPYQIVRLWVNVDDVLRTIYNY